MARYCLKRHCGALERVQQSSAKGHASGAGRDRRRCLTATQNVPFSLWEQNSTVEKASFLLQTEGLSMGGRRVGHGCSLQVSADLSLCCWACALPGARISCLVICQIRNPIPLKTNPAEREKTNRVSRWIGSLAWLMLMPTEGQR